MMSLIHLPACTPAAVVALPKHHGLARRLISLGITPGSEIQVLHNWGSGPVIVEVHGARLALGRGQAARVAVQPLADSEQGPGECESPEGWAAASDDER